MNFINRPYIQGETIAALATPVGEGGIAIIRISGSEALVVADRLFSKKVSAFVSHTAHYGIISWKGERIDEALALVMHGPRSYTGEDTVELQCHGGRVASQKVLEAAIFGGARAALPGEFTFKAFMNGKLDLAQAEAVQELIGARSLEGFACAQKHLEGALSKTIRGFQVELTQIAAILEAWVDFPEEGLEFATQEELRADMESLLQRMRHLLDTFTEGQKLSHGVHVAIIGAPNAGKSSLMNALLRKERAIVTEIAGTTRDLIQEEMMMGGVTIHLTDTAGIRETDEVIEKEGIRRSRKMMEEADLVLLVVDAKTGEMPDYDPSKSLLVWNKCDLIHNNLNVGLFSSDSEEFTQQICGFFDAEDGQTPFLGQKDTRDASKTPGEEGVKSETQMKRDGLFVSAKTGEGIALLREKIIERTARIVKGDVLITSQRHYTALAQSCHYLEKVVEDLDLSPEFLNADVREALRYLGEIIGTNITEDVLSAIFAKFCVGK
ncbi:MAG: tRNA uridine-5-carboxymethylaminomethyl(34) synthesis GTPase MnmE [Chlamydiales bacterium]